MSRHHEMSHADAAWFHMDRPTNLMVINGVLWFDEPLGWDRVREILRTRMVERFSRFSQRVVEGGPLAGPHWEEDPNFDLDLHVHHLALPAPGGQEALQELVGDLMAQPLDPSKPLWHAYLIDGYGSGSALYMRLHHCIADGIALARVMLMLTDDEPDAATAGIADEEPPAVGDGLLHRLTAPVGAAAHAARAATGAVVHEGIETLLHPAHAGELASEAEQGTRALVKVLTAAAETPTVLKGELGVAHRVAWSQPIPLDEVNRVRHAFGGTVNDVLVAAVSGGLGRYLAERENATQELHAMVPFNLRPLDEPLPRELGNRFGLVLLALPVALTDPVERLHEVTRRMAEIKRSPEGAIAYGILGLMGRTPATVEDRLVDLFSSKATTVLTNVPGPRQSVYLAGVRLGGVLVWAPSSGSVGMSVSIFSYDGAVTVGFLADAGLVPDPEGIVDGFGIEMRMLDRAARREASP